MIFNELIKVVTRKPLVLLFTICATFGMGQFVSAQPMVIGWGDDTYGQIDIPPDLTNVVAIAAGDLHSLALLSNGTVVGWGAGTFVANPEDFVNYGQAIPPVGLTNVTAITASELHSLALKNDGTVTAWGVGTNNTGSYPNYGQSAIPPGLSNVTAIAAGHYHNVALKSNGTVVAWGDNSVGQTNVPAGLTNVVAIAAGRFHSLALRNDGMVVAWGYNGSGQTDIPPGLSGVKSIAAGAYHSLVLLSNGAVVAWGNGQINVPVGLTNAMAISAGYNHDLALTSNGTIVVWGEAYSETSALPRLFNVSALATGSAHALALGYDNDFFADRRPISGTNIVFNGSNIGATGEPNEPNPPSVFTEPETNSVWYQWTAPASGGVVINVSLFSAPIIAVYTNNTLATLVQIAANSTTFSKARAAFTAVSNVTYEMAIQGSIAGNGTVDEGNFTATLVETPPPANDLFANRTVISNLYSATAGSFLGASREVGEPTGTPAYPQTLWWTWIAPTNFGNSNIPVRLMADSINWTPAIGVYTGSVVTALSPVSINTQDNGFVDVKVQFSATRTAAFTAIPGVTYQISVSGFGGDPGGNVISPRFGNWQFRLNASGLILTLTNCIATDNNDGGDYDSWNFSGTAIISNSGSAISHPLRVRAFSVSGVSVLGVDSGYVTTDQVFCSTNYIGSLTNGQTISVTVTGTIPPATSSGYGYGAYLELEEQPITNMWFTVDHLLMGFADWPKLTDFPNGPGGGVIRLDPDFIGSSTFNILKTVSIQGTVALPEGSSMPYTGNAVYFDNTIDNFTNTIWSASKFTVTNGFFTAGSVTSNTTVSLKAQYSYGGLLYNTTTNILVINLPPPVLNGLKNLTNGNFSLTLNGVPGRNHVIEAATNLTPPVIWTPMTTNLTGTNGVFNYTNSSTTNFPKRFFRAREM
jgi:Regulator of chromosome condensation (RCC1) repeat